MRSFVVCLCAGLVLSLVHVSSAGPPGGGQGGKGLGGPGGQKGPPGQGGPQGQHGNGGPPRPGEILLGFVQDQLQLTDAQRQQLATLQSQVDAQLAQILTAQQVQQLAAGPPMGGPGGRQQAVNQNGNSSSRSKSGRSGRNNKQ
jgi:hypothetical protein